MKIKPTNVATLAIVACLSASQAMASTNKLSCDWPQGLHNQINSLNSDNAKKPSDSETLLQLSTTYQALGMGQKALHFADKAIAIQPKSGAAQVAKVHALHLLGQVDKALKLANHVYANSAKYDFGRGMNSWLRHSVLGIYLEQGKLESAEKMILKQFPNVLDLVNKPVETGSLQLGIPIHTLEPLIYIYRKTGRVEQAKGLARHLQGFSAESFFEVTPDKLQATQHWLLASVWAGVPESPKKIVASLGKAYDMGFTTGWRFNYAHHPVYWPIHQDAAFIKLIDRIEADMLRAKGCLAS